MFVSKEWSPAGLARLSSRRVKSSSRSRSDDHDDADQLNPSHSDRLCFRVYGYILDRLVDRRVAIRVEGRPRH